MNVDDDLIGVDVSVGVSVDVGAGVVDVVEVG